MNYKTLNDYELVSKVNESEEATELLFIKYQPLIYRTAKKIYEGYVKDKRMGIDINDLIQEGMIGFSSAINTYNEHKDTLFFTYAAKCIESKILTSVKHANRKKYTLLNNSLSIEDIEDNFNINIDSIVGDDDSNPEEILLDVEDVNHLIEEMMKELTPFESQVFELKKSGFNYREIAAILDADIKSIDNAIQRIKTKIKNRLKKTSN